MTDRPVLALLPWGDVIDGFLARIGVTLDEFRSTFRGSWMFGYAEALRRNGVETVLIVFSNSVRHPLRFTHEPSGTPVTVLPAPFRLRVIRLVRSAAKRLRLSNTFFGRLVDDIASYAALPFFRVAQELKRVRAAAILCQEYEYQRFDLLTMFRLPLFATFQGGGERRLGPLERFFRPQAMRRAAGIVAPTAAERDRIHLRYGADIPVAMIPNPVDVDDWRPIDRAAARAELDITSEAFVAVWHGRAEILPKGLDILFEAWERVEVLPRLLLLVGDGGDSIRLRRMVATTPHVRWISSFVADRLFLRKCLSAADLYVLPSRREGFPVAPIEALAASLPVVAADASGMREIVGTDLEAAGIVVPVGVAAQFATAIDTLARDSVLRSQLSANARARARRFDSASVGEQLRAFFFGDGVSRR